jgi:hypothetical protein
MPELRSEVGPLTLRLEKVTQTLEWVRIEEFVESTRCGVGRPPHDRGSSHFGKRSKRKIGTGATVDGTDGI